MAVFFFLFVISLTIPTLVNAAEISVSPHPESQNIVRVTVWGWDGFYPRVAVFRHTSTFDKEIVRCSIVPRLSATVDSKESFDFTLPEEEVWSFVLVKTRQSSKEQWVESCVGSDAIETNLSAVIECQFPGFDRCRDSQAAPASKPSPSTSQPPQSNTPSKSGAQSSFSLPKDPTRFAGMKILDLFNPIGTGAGLLQVILGLALAVSFLFFALGAVRYMLSSGDAKKAEEARNHITMAVVGLVIVVVAFFLVQILGRIFGTGITR